MEEVEYTLEELKLIAHVLNVLSLYTDKTAGVALNNFHISRFYNSTHHIAKNTLQYRIYEKYKGWEPEEERYGSGYNYILAAGKLKIRRRY
jgi:hypothetical protein